jgi:hypothetical protein
LAPPEALPKEKRVVARAPLLAILIAFQKSAEVLIKRADGGKLVCTAFEQGGGIGIMEDTIKYLNGKLGQKNNAKEDEYECLFRLITVLSKIYGAASEVRALPSQLNCILPIMKQYIDSFINGENQPKSENKNDSLDGDEFVIESSDMVNFLSTLCDLSQREENRLALINGKVVQALFHAFSLTNPPPVLVNNPKLLWNIGGTVQHICSTNEKNVQYLLDDSDVFGLMSKALKKLAKDKQFKYARLMTTAASSLVQKSKEAAHRFFQIQPEDKSMFLSTLALIDAADGERRLGKTVCIDLFFCRILFVVNVR